MDKLTEIEHDLQTLRNEMYRKNTEALRQIINLEREIGQIAHKLLEMGVQINNLGILLRKNYGIDEDDHSN